MCLSFALQNVCYNTTVLETIPLWCHTQCSCLVLVNGTFDSFFLSKKKQHLWFLKFKNTLTRNKGLRRSGCRKQSVKLDYFPLWSCHYSVWLSPGLDQKSPVCLVRDQYEKKASESEMRITLKKWSWDQDQSTVTPPLGRRLVVVSFQTGLRVCWPVNSSLNTDSTLCPVIWCLQSRQTTISPSYVILTTAYGACILMLARAPRATKGGQQCSRYSLR